MTIKEANNYMKMRFEYETEIYSIAHEATDNGILTKEIYETLTNEEKIDVAKDVKWRFKSEFGWLLA